MIAITITQAIKVHTQLITETGGSAGVRDYGLLESAILSPFQTFDGGEIYPSVKQKAAQMCYALISNHPFVDGNKRIGVVVMMLLLELNGQNLHYTQQELIDLGLSIAKSEMEPEQIEKWLDEHT